MMKRIATAELLDSDAGTPREIAASLRDLDRINIWFGGDRASASMIRSIAQRTGKTDLTLLEVAAGSGRSARRVAEFVRRQGINGGDADRKSCLECGDARQRPPV